MYCPNCKQEYDGNFCPECGTQLIETPVQNVGTNVSLGDANAISGGVHLTDSHNVQNIQNTTNTTTNTTIDNSQTVNNSTVYAAQKTDTEILQDNENQFLQEIQRRFADGILEQRELAELNQLCIQWHINPTRASQMIEQVRKSATILQNGQGNEFLANQILQEVYSAIQTNQPDILRRKFRTLEQIARTTDDSNVQFYYQLLLASLSPENCTVEFINSRTDNYWQLFWAHVAYVKLGNVDNGVVLLPRLGGFGCPQGDTALLMAIDNIADYRNNKQDYYLQQAKNYLEQAQQLGMSEQLSGLWYAAKERMAEEPKPEDWFRFYVDTTLKELGPVKAPEMPMNNAPKIPTPPPVPKFNAQNVKLSQMQGFNPLEAARQMGLGQVVGSQQSQAAPPPMPIMPGTPPVIPTEPDTTNE